MAQSIAKTCFFPGAAQQGKAVHAPIPAPPGLEHLAMPLAKAGGNGEAAPTTTVMVRNLPRKLGIASLMKELLLYVPMGSFDFVYVPSDQQGSENIGYAFVNFLDASGAQQLVASMAGKAWQVIETTRRVKVAPSQVQGFTANLEHCIGRIAPDAEERHLPWIFKNGEQVHFSMAKAAHLRQISLKGLGQTPDRQLHMLPAVALKGSVTPSTESGTPATSTPTMSPRREMPRMDKAEVAAPLGEAAAPSAADIVASERYRRTSERVAGQLRQLLAQQARRRCLAAGAGGIAA